MFKGLTGLNEAVKGGNMDILRMADGEAKLLRILATADEIIGVFEHTEQFGGNWKTITCLDKNFKKNGECPLCLAGKNASFKAYIPVLDRTDGKVKVFKASKTVVKQILGLVEEYGNITERDFKISRSGTRFDTTYQFFPKDPKKEDLSGYEVPDIEERVTPMSKESILTLMNGNVEEDTDVEDDTPTSVVEKADYPF